MMADWLAPERLLGRPYSDLDCAFGKGWLPVCNISQGGYFIQECLYQLRANGIPECWFSSMHAERELQPNLWFY